MWHPCELVPEDPFDGGEDPEYDINHPTDGDRPDEEDDPLAKAKEYFEAYLHGPKCCSADCRWLFPRGLLEDSFEKFRATRDYSKRLLLMQGHIKIRATEKGYTASYHLFEHQVCKSFLSALYDISPTTLGGVVKFIKECRRANVSAIIPPTDGRGRCRSENRLDTRTEAAVREFISQYGFLPNHYGHQYRPRKDWVCMPPGVSVTSMFKEFLNSRRLRGSRTLSLPTFRRILAQYKVCTGTRMMTDVCNACKAYHMKMADKHLDPAERVRLTKDHVEHIDEARQAYYLRHYFMELSRTDDHVLSVCFDYGAAIGMRCNASVAYYNSKPECQVMCIFDGKGQRHFVELYNDADSEKKPSTVFSMFVNILRHLLKQYVGVTHLLITVDSGSGNKSYNMIKMFSTLVMETGLGAELGLDFVLVLYPPVGHTYMQCDSLFGAVARRLRNSEVFKDDDIVHAISGVSNVEKVEMFPREKNLDYASYAWQYCVERLTFKVYPELNGLLGARLLVYNRGSQSVLIKYTFKHYALDEGWREEPVLLSNYTELTGAQPAPAMYAGPLGQRYIVLYGLWQMRNVLPPEIAKEMCPSEEPNKDLAGRKEKIEEANEMHAEWRQARLENSNIRELRDADALARVVKTGGSVYRKRARSHSSENDEDEDAMVDEDEEVVEMVEYDRPGPSIDSEGHEVWEVDAVVNKRGSGDQTQYRVRYRGYPPDDDQWLLARYVHESYVHRYEEQKQQSEETKRQLKKAKMEEMERLAAETTEAELQEAALRAARTVMTQRGRAVVHSKQYSAFVNKKKS